jgi:amino acid transporter
LTNGYTSTVAIFTVIIAYGMMAVATLTKFWREDLAGGKLYLTALPAVGIVLLAYTLFVNIYPVPAFPFNMLPYIVIAYMVVGFVILARVRKPEIQGDIYAVMGMVGELRIHEIVDHPNWVVGCMIPRRLFGSGPT